MSLGLLNFLKDVTCTEFIVPFLLHCQFNKLVILMGHGGRHVILAHKTMLYQFKVLTGLYPVSKKKRDDRNLSGCTTIITPHILQR